jgi:HEAT repeat protein
MRRMIPAVAAAFIFFATGCREHGQNQDGSQQSLATLIGILKTDPSPKVRAKAATDLAAHAYVDHPDDMEAVSEALIAALADKDELVRDDAAWGLEVLSRREPRLAAGLLKRLITSWKVDNRWGNVSQETRPSWIRAMGGHKSAADKLTEHLRRGKPSVEDRETIAEILGWCGLEEAVPGLLLLAQDQEMGPTFRAGMVHLLGDEHLCKQTIAPLASFLKEDPAPEVRARAAEGLAVWVWSERHAEDLKMVNEALRAATGDKDESVRAAVAEALRMIKDAEAEKAKAEEPKR